MRYLTTTITIDESPIKRRVLRFEMIDAHVVLDSDVDEERASTRHKFRPARQWVRHNSRHSTIERRSVPQHVIDAAMADIRSQIVYRDEVKHGQ